MVVMGRVSAPFGVKGWIKVQPFTAAAANLLSYTVWWLGGGGGWLKYAVADVQVHGRSVVAQLEGCEDREAAARFRGMQVAIPRDALPTTDANEFYWADLIGLKVVNSAARDLGQVVRILETGANDVLVVEGERERLIPFIADVIRKVDLAGGVITVDWGADF
ncbi:MAG: ribosome maturation factor RimM [Betaproteobacteria bacterium RIFCSPLOWO2_12_FULL_62_58]|nr:MAG: ribosome maturation factor RimM [Betaproteobacteria bacterium RIFCSPLOWO2_12_FULL_62_58]